jgi:hypothetical protein
MEPYDLSVERVVIEHVKRLPFMHRQRPDGLPAVLLRLKGAVEVRLAVEVLCIVGMILDSDHFNMTTRMRVLMLAQMGWSKPLSLQIYKNLMFAAPTLHGYEPAGLSMMTRKQLTDLFGAVFGGMLADTFAEPEKFAVFHAMLMRNYDAQIYRPATLLEVQVVTESALKNADELPLSEIVINWAAHGARFGAVPEPEYLPVTVAKELFEQWTGIEAPELTFNLSPLTNDYEDLASQAAPEVQQADGTQ